MKIAEHSVACFVEGFDEESRMLRRSLMRYMNLALILVLRSISSAVKQRFPTLEHVVEAGTIQQCPPDSQFGYTAAKQYIHLVFFDWLWYV